MKILLDTNIVLDVLLKRHTFYELSKSVMDLASFEEIELYVSASAITDIYYVVNRNLKDAELTRKLIVNLLKAVHIAAVTEAEIRNALELSELSWKDFEDAVQYCAAVGENMDGVVTRNKNDYEKSYIAVWTPQELLELLSL